MGGGMPGPSPGPNPAMKALEGLAGVPSPQREEKAMAEASAQLQIALIGVYGRSAKAADHLAKAYQEIQKAREALKELASAPVNPPPDLLGSGGPMPMGMPGPGV